MRKVLCVFGTRPEAIKMAPVVRSLGAEKRLRTVVCVTAQHREMLDDVLALFRIRPSHDLDVMRPGQSLEHVARNVLERVAPVLRRERPDLVLVHGDTSTAFLTALAAFYQRIPVGHVEAGLRSHDYGHPFPEEANRRLSDALCSLHFAPTAAARRNLLREDVPARSIFVTGNTVIDALKWAVGAGGRVRDPALARCLDSLRPQDRLVLVTAHRRENFGRPFLNICRALKRVADSLADVRIAYPVHPNPNVSGPARSLLSRHPRIALLPPLNYLDFALLLQRSRLVVTDSGGIQEEAPSLGKPVLVLRRVTERPEAVCAGAALVVGTDERRIAAQLRALLLDARLYRRMAAAVNPYGDGKASERVAAAVLHYFKLGKKPKDFASD